MQQNFEDAMLDEAFDVLNNESRTWICKSIAAQLQNTPGEHFCNLLCQPKDVTGEFMRAAVYVADKYKLALSTKVADVPPLGGVIIMVKFSWEALVKP